jgi:hypothetical protein
MAPVLETHNPGLGWAIPNLPRRSSTYARTSRCDKTGAVARLLLCRRSIYRTARRVFPHGDPEGLAMMTNALDCMVRAIEMDSKAAACTDAPAIALYRDLAQQWRTLYDQAIWQDFAEAR